MNKLGIVQRVKLTTLCYITAGKLRVVDRCAETLETLAFDTVGSTVDRSKTTKLTMGSKSCTTSGQLGGNEESESTVDYDEMFDCTSTQAQVYGKGMHGAYCMAIYRENSS